MIYVGIVGIIVVYLCRSNVNISVIVWIAT